jgi:hypothetical protein
LLSSILLFPLSVLQFPVAAPARLLPGYYKLAVGEAVIFFRVLFGGKHPVKIIPCFPGCFFYFLRQEVIDLYWLPIITVHKKLIYRLF